MEEKRPTCHHCRCSELSLESKVPSILIVCSSRFVHNIADLITERQKGVWREERRGLCLCHREVGVFDRVEAEGWLCQVVAHVLAVEHVR